MSLLNITTQALGFNDIGATSNPLQQPINYRRIIAGLEVENPQTQMFVVEPLGTTTVVDGTRSTSIDGTTAFSLTLSTLETSRYRILSTGGTAPVFRTARTIPTTGIALTLVLNSNQTVTVTAASGTPFANAVVGDVVFIPGISTGDTTSPFNTLNLGYWTLLSKTSSTVITLSRPTGEVFEGSGEVVTTTADIEFQVFSTAGVQVGDTVDLSSGFATTTLRAYPIVAVNPLWIEITSTTPLGDETGITPTATGMVIYSAAKRWVHIECDQEVVVRLNGDTGSFVRMTPWIPGAAPTGTPAEFRITGPVWKLQIVSKVNVATGVVVLSAE